MEHPQTSKEGQGQVWQPKACSSPQEAFVQSFEQMRFTRLGPQSGALISLGFSVVCSVSRADQGKKRTDDAFERSPSANVLGLSLAYQAPSDLEKFGGGVGVSFTREYFVSRRTAVGINAAPRVFPGDPRHLAFGYGLSLKHYLGNWGETESSGLYLSYGLMMQMNWLKGRSGAATGHDTKMALGFDWTSKHTTPVVELGYHLTQVRGFDRETLWWPYTELLLGIRF